MQNKSLRHPLVCQATNAPFLGLSLHSRFLRGLEKDFCISLPHPARTGLSVEDCNRWAVLVPSSEGLSCPPRHLTPTYLITLLKTGHVMDTSPDLPSSLHHVGCLSLWSNLNITIRLLPPGEGPFCSLAACFPPVPGSLSVSLLLPTCTHTAIPRLPLSASLISLFARKPLSPAL